MRLFKATAIALVAGVGLAFVGAQAFAQSSDASSTSTTSSAGITTNDTFDGGVSSTNLTATHTQGTAIAAALSVGDFTISGGASLAGFQGASFSSSGFVKASQAASAAAAGGTTGSTNASGSGGGGSFFGASASERSSLAAGYSASACFFCIDDGATSTLALATSSAWASVSHSESVGSTSTSGTTSAGDSLASLFVFGQTIAVPHSGDLHDASPVPPQAFLNSSAAMNVSGSLALNVVAGVGNQQGNSLETAAELDGAGSTTAGANSLNVENQQTIADSGDIHDWAKAPAAGTTGELAFITGTALENIDGSAAVNLAAGVGNQQSNTMVLAH